MRACADVMCVHAGGFRGWADGGRRFGRTGGLFIYVVLGVGLAGRCDSVGTESLKAKMFVVINSSKNICRLWCLRRRRT